MSSLAHPAVADDQRTERIERRLALLSTAQWLTVELAEHHKDCHPCAATWEPCPKGARLSIREQAAWDALEALP